MEFTDQQLFERCGTKLSEVKVKQVLDNCKEYGLNSIGGILKVGAVVDGYKILGYLGAGTWGTACFASKNEFYFVLKFMRVNDGQSGPTKEFEILNAQLTSENYENCLTALEWNEWKEFYDNDVKQNLTDKKQKLRYMVIKLAGPSLRVISQRYSLNSKCAFPIKQGILLMKKSLLALQLLHKDNFIHRDLKLDNMTVDINNDENVVILDYGLVCKAPSENKLNSFRDDYKAWFESFFTFEYALARREQSATDSNDEAGTFWATRNSHAVQILKHIDNLKFSQKMTFDFVQTCLQNMIDEANGIRVIPYMYKKVNDFSKIIVNGNYEFSGSKKDKKGRQRFDCKSCDFTIYVDIAEFEEADDGSIATIVDTLHEHHKCTQN